MKKLKNLWNENRVLFALFVIIIVCFLIIITVCFKYFFGSSKSSYGDRLNGIEEVKITDETEKNFLEAMKNDELISEATFKVRGKIIYITLTFKEQVTLVEAQSKALASLGNFEEKYLSFYDINYTLKNNGSENSEGFLIMGAKNVNGNGLIWNNNTVVKDVSE